jgi:hypothetical protein
MYKKWNKYNIFNRHGEEKETQECKEITKNVFWQFCDNDLTKCNGSSKKKNENTMKHKSTKRATITLRC